MTDRRADKAAEDSVDDSRLLEGEDLDSPYLDDATHWVQVYAELLAVKRDLLHVVEERIASMQVEGRREVARTDLVVLDAEMKRFARRHDFWSRRSEELGAAPEIDAGS